jgi:hypothetical protein
MTLRYNGRSGFIRHLFLHSNLIVPRNMLPDLKLLWFNKQRPRFLEVWLVELYLKSHC